MLKYFVILIFIFGMTNLSIAQEETNDNIEKEYLISFEKAKELLKRKKYIQANSLLLKLANQEEINIVDCSISSEVYNQLGVSYFRLGNKIKAFEVWKDITLPLRIECKDIDPNRIAQTYINIAVTFELFSDYIKAIEYFNLGLNTVETAGLLYKYKRHVNWLRNLYWNSRKLGDSFKAEAYIFKGITILDSLDMKNSDLYVGLILDLALNFSDRKNYKLSVQYFDIAKRIIEKTDSQKKGSYYRYFATFKRDIKEYSSSEKLATKAIQYCESKKDQRDYGKYFETLGLTLLEEEKYENALKNFSKALKFKNEVNARPFAISLSYENIASVHYKLNNLDSALYFIDLSMEKLHSFDKGIDLGKYESLRANDFGKKDMVRKMEMKGRFLNEQFKLTQKSEFLYQAEQVYTEADSLVFLMRKEIQNNESKIHLGSTLEKIYNGAIKNEFLLWELTKDEKYLKKAYYYTSENKAVVFTETKEELNAVWEILDEEIRTEYLSILENLKSNNYQKQYAVLNSDTTAYQKLNTKYVKLSDKRELLLGRIKKEFPSFYKQIYKVIQPKSILYLQKNLNDDNAIIEYYLDGKDLYTYLITHDNFEVFRQKTIYNLDSLFEAFGEESAVFLNEEDISSMSKVLYPILFTKELNESLSSQDIERLIIIRDKKMNKVSFSALSFGDNLPDDYLIQKYALSYAFNSKNIWEDEVEKKKKEIDFGGFATNYNQKSLKAIMQDRIFWKYGNPPNLAVLEKSVPELEEVSDLYDSEIWTGNEATLKNFKSQTSKYDILHLSLHSIIAKGNNEQNAMIFQKTENDSNFVLKSADIIGMRLDNSLTILSACFSSDGRVMSGEGINSLSRNFAIAGSPAVIASQWQAYEGQTMDLFKLFYQYLNKGDTKDVALQKAQKYYLKNVKGLYASPANWAHLILIGDPKEIAMNSWSVFISNYFKAQNIGLLILVLFFFYLLRFKW